MLSFQHHKENDMKAAFLIGWFDGSDGACGDETGIHGPEDLISKFSADPSSVDHWVFEVEKEEDAITQGRAKAFMENWTAHDSCTAVVLV
jgi:hypothetical protein